MLLLRPWRCVDGRITFCDVDYKIRKEEQDQQFWAAVYDKFQKWKEELEKAFQDAQRPSAVRPVFRTFDGLLSQSGKSQGEQVREKERAPSQYVAWWNCMIAQRLRNIDIVLSRPKHLAHKLSVDP